MTLSSAELDRMPVIVGVGEDVARGQTWPDLRGPMELMHVAADAAIADCAAPDGGARVRAGIDAVSVVNILAWDYANAPAMLADTLGLGDGARTYLPVGGNTPQAELHRLAAAIVAGEVRAALLAGAEAMAARSAARKAGERADWGTWPTAIETPAAREGAHPLEVVHKMMLPPVTYPMFEPAIRAAAGRTPAEHTAHLGRLMAPFTEVAAKNPMSWFGVAHTADELVTPTPQNRLVGEPYTKYLNAVLNVDQGAAVIVTSAGQARAWGIPDDRWVWVLGGGECNDVWYVSERPDFATSPAMQVAFSRALAGAGVGVDDLARFDLYSCFPSAVQYAQGALGLAADDSRPLTVTGGLPYFGGPGNSYVTHSIAAMARALRAAPGCAGLVTANGWFATKHAAGVYASRPPTQPYVWHDPASDQAAIDAVAHPTLAATWPAAPTPATIDAYTVLHGRDGAPEAAVVLVRRGPVAGGERTPAVSYDADVLAAVADGEWLGRTVNAWQPDGSVERRFAPD